MIEGAGHTQESDAPDRTREASPALRVGLGHWQYVGEMPAIVRPMDPVGAVGHLQTFAVASQVVLT